MAKACGGRGCGLAAGAGSAEAKATGWAEGTGSGGAGPWEESLGGPGRSSAPRFGNPALQPWLRGVWGKPQNHVWPSGFHRAGNDPSLPTACQFLWRGLWAGLRAGLSFRVAPWLWGCALGEGSRRRRPWLPSSILQRGRPWGNSFLWGIRWAQPHSTAEAFSKALLSTPVAKPGLSPPLLSTQHPKSQYSYLQDGNTSPPLKVFL